MTPDRLKAEIEAFNASVKDCDSVIVVSISASLNNPTSVITSKTLSRDSEFSVGETLTTFKSSGDKKNPLAKTRLANKDFGSWQSILTDTAPVVNGFVAVPFKSTPNSELCYSRARKLAYFVALKTLELQVKTLEQAIIPRESTIDHLNTLLVAGER